MSQLMTETPAVAIQLPRYRTAARMLPEGELQPGEASGGVDIYLVFVDPT